MSKYDEHKATEVIDNKDGTFTVKYFGDDVGYFSKIKSSLQGVHYRYRWVSVHGVLGYAYSKTQAKRELYRSYM